MPNSTPGPHQPPFGQSATSQHQKSPKSTRYQPTMATIPEVAENQENLARSSISDKSHQRFLFIIDNAKFLKNNKNSQSVPKFVKKNQITVQAEIHHHNN